MKRLFLLGALLAVLPVQSALAATTSVRYSAGFYLENTTCFFENDPPEDIIAILTIITNSKGYVTVARNGRFPFATSLKGTPGKKPGRIKVSGEAVRGRYLVSEKMNIRLRGRRGTVKLTTTVTEAGERCRLVYSGQISR